MRTIAPSLRLLALAALIGSLSVASPVHAQTNDVPDAAPSAMQQTNDGDAQPTSSMAEPMSKDKHDDMHVEMRIKTLHDKLMITSAQEDEWSKVAQTMRDNESKMDDMIKTRHANAEGMTAIDDIKSYQQITQAHADGMTKMLSAFEPLYKDLSDAQKKNADMIFGHFEGHHDMKHKKTHS